MNGKKTQNPANEQSVQTMIAEAIRAKRDQMNSSVVNDDEWEKLEASVLADIEMFSRSDEKTYLDVDKAPAKPIPVTTVVQAADAEDISAVGDPVLNAKQQSVSAADSLSPVKEEETAHDRPNEDGLLAELSDLSMRYENVEYQRAHQYQEVLRRMGDVMRLIFLYSHELVKQLNRLRIAIPRDYPLFGKVNFTNLTWREGFADYRTTSIDGKAHLNFVSLSYQLGSAEQFCVEREGDAVENFRRLLIDCNVQAKYEEVKNDRFRIEKGIFNFPCEVRINIRFQADYEREVVVITTKNLSRLGTIVYELPAASINRQALDELGKLILARPNSWRSLVKI